MVKRSIETNETELEESEISFAKVPNDYLHESEFSFAKDQNFHLQRSKSTLVPIYINYFERM